MQKAQKYFLNEYIHIYYVMSIYVCVCVENGIWENTTKPSLQLFCN